jgi:hypothetical protein
VVLLATGGFLVYSGAVAESVNYFTQVPVTATVKKGLGLW